MIKIENLSKSFGDIKILDDINLHIEKNEFAVLLGASGSGKSTLLKILGWELDFESGKICLNSRIYQNKVKKDKNIQTIAQQSLLMPWLSAKENIKFALSCSGIKDSKQREKIALKYLELVHLEQRADFFPRALSGGQASRVNIARALALNPEILLLDEPFAALDPVIRLKLQNELKALSKNKTIIFVTHDIEEAMILADKIIVLSSGHIIKSIKNPHFEPNSLGFFELKSQIFELLNGKNISIEYNI